MRLGLRGLPGAIVGAVGTCAVCAGVATGVMAVGSGAVASAVGQPGSWTVTVGAASRPLYPGTDATMPYDVHNGSSGPLLLQGTTANIRLKGAPDGCRAEWFRVASNAVPTDTEVAPGDTVHGSLVLAFDSAPASQDACQNMSFDVVVTAN